MQGQVQGMPGVVPAPSPVGPRGSAHAAATNAGQAAGGGGGPAGHGPSGAVAGGPAGSGGVSPLAGPTPPPSAPKRKVLVIIDPSTGLPIDMSGGGGGQGGGGGAGPGAVDRGTNNVPPGAGFPGGRMAGIAHQQHQQPQGVSASGAHPGESSAAREMREKVQAALKGDTVPGGPAIAASAAATAATGVSAAVPTAVAKATSSSGGGNTSPPAFKGPAAAGAKSRGLPASAVDTSAAVEVSFGSYGECDSDKAVAADKNDGSEVKMTPAATAKSDADAAAVAAAAVAANEAAKKDAEVKAAKVAEEVHIIGDTWPKRYRTRTQQTDWLVNYFQSDSGLDHMNGEGVWKECEEGVNTWQHGTGRSTYVEPSMSCLCCDCRRYLAHVVCKRTRRRLALLLGKK